MQLLPWNDVMYGRKLSAADREEKKRLAQKIKRILTALSYIVSGKCDPMIQLYSRGTTRTFLFLSLLSARWPAAQSPMENLRVWFVISCEQREDGII